MRKFCWFSKCWLLALKVTSAHTDMSMKSTAHLLTSMPRLARIPPGAMPSRVAFGNQPARNTVQVDCKEAEISHARQRKNAGSAASMVWNTHDLPGKPATAWPCDSLSRCKYVFTPMLSGLRWPGQTVMGSWPPAFPLWNKGWHTHTHTHTHAGETLAPKWGLFTLNISCIKGFDSEANDPLIKPRQLSGSGTSSTAMTEPGETNRIPPNKGKDSQPKSLWCQWRNIH